MEDMASRGRSRTRCNQGKNGRASRVQRSQSPLFSEKEGRAGSKSKRRGGDTSTESTDSKRRKSVNNVPAKTAPRPTIDTNSEEQHKVTAMDTSQPDDDFRVALGFNS